MKRILYIQYTNPAGYPPLEHSSRILAGASWRVAFLGTRGLFVDALQFPPHPNIVVRYLGFCPGGWRQKLHYAYYCLWVLVCAAIWRPRWIYASDALVSPVALLLSYVPGLRVLYHEHDSPATAQGAFQRVILAARKRMAHRAACCILPNQARIERFNAETGIPRQPLCVWNTPAAREAAQPHGPANGALVLLYHGSIVPERLPLPVLNALALLPDSVSLRVVGYETVGSLGYVDKLRAAAGQLGVSARIEIVGAVPRADLIAWCRRSDVGLSFMPLHAADANQSTMTGASNKAFDYLACGLPVLVSDLPDWRAMYVDGGYALPCDPQDPESIARAVRRFLDEPDLARSMGEKGRQRILVDWNYETCFDPVLRRMEGRTADAVTARAALEQLP